MMNRDFGKYLRRKRLDLGMSQRKLADRLGYTSQFIANWERGASSPPIKILPMIAKVLEIPNQEIIQTLSEISAKFWKKLFSSRN